MSRRFGAVLFVVYIVIGLVVAAGHHYFEHLGALKPIASAVLAVLLWPLVLFGTACISSRASIGSGDSDNGLTEAAIELVYRGAVGQPDSTMCPLW
jgi:hypothetical protein